MEDAVELYERRNISEEELRAKIGMGYKEAVRRWYAVRVAMGTGVVRYAKLAGWITAEQFKAIIEEGGGHGDNT